MYVNKNEEMRYFIQINPDILICICMIMRGLNM